LTVSTKSGGSQRLFIGIPLNTEQRARIASLEDSLRSVLHAVRWVTPENLHVTLKFLGQCETSSVPQLVEALAEGARRMPAELTIGGVGGFPSQGSARIIWVGAADPTGSIQEAFKVIERGAKKCGVEKERKPYRPHITIGRSRKAPAAVPDDSSAMCPVERMPVEEVALYSSELSSGPPVYKIIGRAPVGAP